MYYSRLLCIQWKLFFVLWDVKLEVESHSSQKIFSKLHLYFSCHKTVISRWGSTSDNRRQHLQFRQYWWTLWSKYMNRYLQGQTFLRLNSFFIFIYFMKRKWMGLNRHQLLRLLQSKLIPTLQDTGWQQLLGFLPLTHWMSVHLCQY